MALNLQVLKKTIIEKARKSISITNLKGLPREDLVKYFDSMHKSARNFKIFNFPLNNFFSPNNSSPTTPPFSLPALSY